MQLTRAFTSSNSAPNSSYRLDLIQQHHALIPVDFDAQLMGEVEVFAVEALPFQNIGSFLDRDAAHSLFQRHSLDKRVSHCG